MTLIDLLFALTTIVNRAQKIWKKSISLWKLAFLVHFPCKNENMEKYMTDEEIVASKLKEKQELEVLRAELQSVKPGRTVYLNTLGNSQNQHGSVFFKVSNLPQLKSDVEKKIKKL